MDETEVKKNNPESRQLAGCSGQLAAVWSRSQMVEWSISGYQRQGDKGTGGPSEPAKRRTGEPVTRAETLIVNWSTGRFVNWWQAESREGVEHWITSIRQRGPSCLEPSPQFLRVHFNVAEDLA